VRVGYKAGGGLDQSAIDPEQMVYQGRDIGPEDEEIAQIPWAGSADSRMLMMTPNEYFDTIDPYTRSPLQGGRDDKYRWTPRGQSSLDNIERIIEGIKEGKVIGAPTFSVGKKPESKVGYSDRLANEDAWGYTGIQEGGHRMEALRQMGHGDKPIPVLQQRHFHVEALPPRPPPPSAEEEAERNRRLQRYQMQNLMRRRKWKKRVGGGE
jgi:hypothetical protein